MSAAAGTCWAEPSSHARLARMEVPRRAALRTFGCCVNWAFLVSRQCTQCPALQAKNDEPDRPLIVIDDFSCTGAQFDHYWTAPFDSNSGGRILPGSLSGPIVFAPLFAAWLAGPRLRPHTNVTFKPVHTVSGILRDSAIAPHRTRIREISLALGAVDSAGTETNDWKGFGGLSHAIAVGGTIPDSCLPIFYLEANGWIPLRARRVRGQLGSACEPRNARVECAVVLR